MDLENEDFSREDLRKEYPQLIDEGTPNKFNSLLRSKAKGSVRKGQKEVVDKNQLLRENDQL